MDLRKAKLLCIALLRALFMLWQPSVALGQSQVAFSYGQLSYPDGQDIGLSSFLVPDDPNTAVTELQGATDIMCLSDSRNTWSQFPVEPGQFVLFMQSPGIAGQWPNISGTCLYNKPIQVTRDGKVSSFGALFAVIRSVSTLPVNEPGSLGPYPGPNISQTGTVPEPGLAFIMIAIDNSTLQSADEDYLGWLNSTANAQASKDHYLAVRLTFPLDDPDHFEIAVDQNSTTVISSTVELAPYVTSSSSYVTVVGFTVWVQYDGVTEILKVFLPSTVSSNVSDPFSDYDPWDAAFVAFTSKSTLPIISTKVSLVDTFSAFSASGLSGIYVGLSGSISMNQSFLNTSRCNQNNDATSISYDIFAWTFNSNGLAPDLPRNPEGTLVDLEGDRERRKRHQRMIVEIIAITIPSVLVFVTLMVVTRSLYRWNVRLTALRKKYEIENGVLDQGGRNFKYKVLSAATKGFSSNALLGSGGFGSVYKGKLVLKGDKKLTEVAVKRISATSKQGAQEFLAEVKIIGQAQHRNLVRLLGWCHEKSELLLVYDFMPNGSLDQHLFRIMDDNSGQTVLTWSRRLKIVSGVAAALTYLHEEWEKRVIHRDVKCSNIMLDRDFNARLGDFGLARLYEHDQAGPSTNFTMVAGTHGYMAPELFHTLKATEKTDVYSFGAVVLEVATGKKPILSVKDRGASEHVLLVDWVWDLYNREALLDAADERLENGYDKGEMMMFLKIGLLCSHPDPDERPSMREVVNIWKGLSPFPLLPWSKPVPSYALSMTAQAGLNSWSRDESDSHNTITVSVGLNSSLRGSDSHTAITPAITEDWDSVSLVQNAEDGGGAHHSLRHRPHTIASLPF